MVSAFKLRDILSSHPTGAALPRIRLITAIEAQSKLKQTLELIALLLEEHPIDTGMGMAIGKTGGEADTVLRLQQHD